MKVTSALAFLFSLSRLLSLPRPEEWRCALSLWGCGVVLPVEHFFPRMKHRGGARLDQTSIVRRCTADWLQLAPRATQKGNHRDPQLATAAQGLGGAEARGFGSSLHLMFCIATPGATAPHLRHGFNKYPCRLPSIDGVPVR